ncbi:hypothetical protein [Larkinella punicea]|uniref:Uncharacterized protein n=1 Tax=Larkinella punicea TaxID=2315727 RepID=A0A368JMV2_9BACT|nr:hypothetical protein [Larkinella punicea]RCR67903.1 hypothetical protein DUE52_19455 [Larkinella punicea]
MEDTELINLWKAYDKKLDENLVLNRKNAEDITKMKVQSLLNAMKPLKIFTLLAGLLWVGLGGTIISNLFIHAYSNMSKFFLFSAAIQLILTAIALWIYLYQLILIHQIDSSEPIVATQEKLARLKSSTLWAARLLFLQLPVWTTFYWSESGFKNGNSVPIFFQIAVSLAFTFLAIWLFRNIHYKNRDKKWFRLLFEGNEWTPVIRSIGLLNEIEAYRLEAKPDKPLTSPAE